MQKLFQSLLIFLILLVGLSSTTAAPTQQNTTLPAPVYLLNEEQQIVRVETDGIINPLTFTPNGVTGFDVSPVDGKLAFVIDNTLHISGPLTEDAEPLMTGTVDPTPEGEFPGIEFVLTQQLSSPLFSPDGQFVYWGQNGINRIPVDGGEPELLLLNEPGEGPPFYTNGFIYHPEEFSPDGTKLLLSYNAVPEAGGLALLDLTTNTIVEVMDDQGYGLCCTAHWNNDGSRVYISSSLLAYYAPGLWFVDPLTGVAQTIIQGFVEDSSTTNLIEGAEQLPDGLVYYFGATFDMSASEIPAYALYRTTEDEIASGVGGVETVLEGFTNIAYVVWEPNGLGALVGQYSLSQDPNVPAQLLYSYYPLDDSAPLLLRVPVSGMQVQAEWGAPQ
jgi:hypothetical protein